MIYYRVRNEDRSIHMENKMVVKMRRPDVLVNILTETAEYNIRYESDNFNQESIREKIISVSTKNDMNDDSSAFTITVASDTRWEELVRPNDLVIIKLNPNETKVGYPNAKDIVKNDVVVVGLLTEIKSEGDYNDGTRLYKLTGQSFAKILLNFELRVIQNVTLPMSVGWLDNRSGVGIESLGTEIQGTSVADTVKYLLVSFLDYVDYTFKSSTGTTESYKERLNLLIDSWTDDEFLLDPSPITSFEGSLNQMIKSVASRPFMEVFFDTYKDKDGYEMSEMIVRRTPFDKSDWEALDELNMYSHEVIQEEVGQNDTETYSVYNVIPGSQLEEEIAIFTAKPQTNESLISHYGYKLLQVENQFLSMMSDEALNSAMENSEDEDDEEEVDTTTDEDTDESEGADPDRVERFSKKLYYWYSMNPLFYSGSFVVAGHPSYRVGKRLIYHDEIKKEKWEFYIEAVQHNFSRESGYTTTINVTRGLKIGGKVKRFQPIYGPPQEFKGGYLGELTLEELNEAGEAERQTPGGGGGVKPALPVKAGTPTTDKYGQRTDPISGGQDFHAGLDYAGNTNDPIYATMSGTVMVAEFNNGGLGNVVWIKHDNDSYFSAYAHLETLNVSAGDKVTKGKRIGGMGTTGYSTGVHLHFVIATVLWGNKANTTIDPGVYLATSQGGGGDSSDSSSGGTTKSANNIMKKATDFGKTFADDKRGATAYHFGGGHGSSTNPLEQSAPYLLDCSSFVWWSYEHAGLRFDRGTNTTGIKASTNIKRKGTGLSISDLNYGDIVYFNNGSHVGMYVDGGKFVGWNGTGTNNYAMGCQIKPMDSGYWGNAWDRDAWVAQP